MASNVNADTTERPMLYVVAGGARNLVRRWPRKMIMITVATAVTTATPMITPSSVRNDLSLWERIEEIAIDAASINLFIKEARQTGGNYSKG